MYCVFIFHFNLNLNVVIYHVRECMCALPMGIHEEDRRQIGVPAAELLMGYEPLGGC